MVSQLSPNDVGRRRVLVRKGSPSHSLSLDAESGSGLACLSVREGRYREGYTMARRIVMLALVTMAVGCGGATATGGNAAVSNGGSATGGNATANGGDPGQGAASGNSLATSPGATSTAGGGQASTPK
jgi:hypothetical protein